MEVLVIGGGGREHALAWKIRQSPLCGTLYSAPGNPGMSQVSERILVPTDAPGDELCRLCRERRVDLAVIGPEAPLAAGLADRLREAGIAVFGPSAGAARIESSKSYARSLMTRAGVPQPRYAAFRDFAAASAYLDALAQEGVPAAVVKANGLAAGKGAIVCDTLVEARAAARAMLVERAFGPAGGEVVIEERLEGEEVSLLVLTDGRDAAALAPAQDYKRIGEDERGPNTGGMGSYAPAPVLTSALEREAMDYIVLPTLRALDEDGAPFRGCLYAGLMKTPSGLKVIEFNCRFGDPETQAVLPLLESDFLALLVAAARGNLGAPELCWAPGCAVSVVLASGGYPGEFETGKVIHGLDEAAAVPGVSVFHAGTASRNGEVVTAGGRVLSVTAVRPTFREAVATAYAAAERVRFEGRYYRTDIGARVVESKVGGRSTAGRKRPACSWEDA